MRITITGGAGYIGCRLCEYFLQQGHQVDCVDWLEWGINPILNIVDHPNFNLYNIDICSAEVEPVLKRADAVVHLAGIIGYPSCNARPELSYRVNVEGTRRVIDASQDQIFVYASTGSVYGALDTTCTESVEVHPISSYATHKHIGEEYLKGTDAVILRPATAFGVSNRLRDDLLVNDFVKKACNQEHMVLFEGNFKRTFLAVNDLVRAFAWGVERYDVMKKQVWNVGDNRLNLTKIEICKIIQKHIPGWHFEINQTIDHDLDGRNYFVDYEKIRNIGFEANETLDQGIQNLIKVYNNF